MYVLDTNILIYFFKGLGNVSKNLLSVPPQSIAVPAIVFYELQVGIKKSLSPQKRLRQLNDFFSIVNVLPFGKTEAKASAEIRALLEKKGRPIGPYDILIAGTALANHSVLITHNISEFERIPDLEILDWY